MIKYLTLLLVSICLPSFADTSSIQQKLAELEKAPPKVGKTLDFIGGMGATTLGKNFLINR